MTLWSRRLSFLLEVLRSPDLLLNEGVNPSEQLLVLPHIEIRPQFPDRGGRLNVQAAVGLRVGEFLSASTRLLCDQLSAAFPGIRISSEQLAAWQDEVGALRTALQELGGKSLDWSLLLEYRPP